MSAHRDNRAKSRPRDERSDAATPDRASADCHERLRKLRLMLGEATKRDVEQAQLAKAATIDKTEEQQDG